ncbi:MAG: phosphopantetheine-binding protein [Chitinophagaceae bacterium]
MEIKETVKGFLQERIGEDVAFSYDDDIFKLGLANSLLALSLVVYLENTFKIRIENEDLDLANFSAVNNIEKFIKRKMELS